MSKLNAPWRWSFKRASNPYSPEAHGEGEYGWDGSYDKFFPLKDGDGNVIADYAGCGSHQIEIAPRHAAILEAAAVMFDFICCRSNDGDGDARDILGRIEMRPEEFDTETTGSIDYRPRAASDVSRQEEFSA